MLFSMLSASTASTDKGQAFGQPRLRSSPHRLTLRVNFLWTLSGNVVYAACQWGMVVVLAKLGTPQLVGEFALALAITAPIVIGAGLSLRSVHVTAAAWLLLLVVYDARNGASVLKVASNSEHTPSKFGSALASQLQLSWRPRALMKLTLLALPVGIVMALISFNTNIPRYFIEHDLGAWDLGIFAAVAYPLAAGTIVVNALGQSAAPRLARYYADRDYRAFSSLMRKLLGLGLAIGIGGIVLIWLAGRPILLLLYRPEYADSLGVFLWLGVAAGISYVASFLGYAMTAARYFRAQLPVFLIATLVTAVGCAILVPRYHLSGAAIATIFAAISQAIGSLAVITHALRSQRVK